MAISPTYCTHKELKRVFPQLDEFDGKTPIYGWSQGILNFTSSVDLYFAPNSGLVDKLFFDGSEVDKIDYVTSATTQVATAVQPAHNTIVVDDNTQFGNNDIIKINGEYFRVVSKTSTDTLELGTITTNRGLFNTNAQHHPVDSNVFRIVDASINDVGGTDSSGLDALSFIYDDDLDICLLLTVDTNPADYLIEAGENFEDLVTQHRGDASRMLDSFLDPNLPTNQLKNKAGEYDYLIVRSTALICASMMIKASDPTSEIANAYMAEAQMYIDKLNNGEAALSYQNTADSSKGVIRDVTYTGAVRPVDTRGHYSGTYDLIKIKITTAGAIGTAKYSVWVKDGDKLGMNEGNQVITDEIVNGDYQTLAGGLQIRFQGTYYNSTAYLNDEWEVEVMGWSEEVDSSSLKPIRMTRKWQ